MQKGSTNAVPLLAVGSTNPTAIGESTFKPVSQSRWLQNFDLPAPRKQVPAHFQCAKPFREGIGFAIHPL